MSNNASKFQTQIDAAKAEHEKIVSVEVDGELFMFRRATKHEVVNMNKAARKQPELAIMHAIGFCRCCFIGPGKPESYDAISDKYPLLFAGSDEQKGIADHLISMAHGEATVTLS